MANELTKFWEGFTLIEEEMKRNRKSLYQQTMFAGSSGC